MLLSTCATLALKGAPTKVGGPPPKAMTPKQKAAVAKHQAAVTKSDAAARKAATAGQAAKVAASNLAKAYVKQKDAAAKLRKKPSATRVGEIEAAEIGAALGAYYDYVGAAPDPQNPGYLTDGTADPAFSAPGLDLALMDPGLDPATGMDTGAELPPVPPMDAVIQNYADVGGILYDGSKGRKPGYIGSYSYYHQTVVNAAHPDRRYGFVFGGDPHNSEWPGNSYDHWVWVHGKKGDSGSIPAFPGKEPGVSGWWDNAVTINPKYKEASEIAKASVAKGYGPIIGNPAWSEFAGLRMDQQGNLFWLPQEAPEYITVPLKQAAALTAQAAAKAAAEALAAEQAAAAKTAADQAAAQAAQDAANALAESAEASAAAPEETEEARAAAAKKRAGAGARFEEPNRVTKKDLLGMMEEVEITRPLSRRPKKAIQRNEKKGTQITTPGAHKRVIRIEDEISVADLADRMGLKASDIIRKLIGMGQMATIQQKLDHDTATLIAGEYNYEVQNVAVTAESLIKDDADLEDTGNLEHRPPIITVMRHVDHGKTSLLDHIRKTRVVAGEAGGITQHIGAYQIEHNGKKITFIDTPGHAAFTAMRARGARLTDLVILVVAADEGVKPQTLEALAHAQAAKVPIIVAINKIDKPEAKPDIPMNELSGQGLVPEAWGGETIYVKVSAHTGEGIPELLEMILLQADVLDLKSDHTRLAKGIVIESMLDKGKGPVARVIVQNGTLQAGQSLVCGTTFGKVRALLNDRGQQVKSAGPSTPVEVLGLGAVPEAGDALSAVSEDAIARQASELQDLARKREDALKHSRMSLEDMFKKLQSGDNSELRIVLKGDVQGSLEAIADSLQKIKHDKVKVQVLYKAVGAISESDIDLAAASGALVFGFNVRPTTQAKALAAKENVQIKTYDIIYELIDEVKLAMGGLLAPIIKENILGQAEVREVFNVSKVGPIAGCFVKSGKIVRNGFGRLLRDNVVIYTAKIQSLRRFKDDAKEVAEGYECGIRLENYMDLKPGDIIECFEQVQHQQAVG
jgi:translation initiation factor IF-2